MKLVKCCLINGAMLMELSLLMCHSFAFPAPENDINLIHLYCFAVAVVVLFFSFVLYDETCFMTKYEASLVHNTKTVTFTTPTCVTK